MQWGAPAFTLAGAFLMAARPHQVVGALTPIAVAAAVAVAAFTAARVPEPEVVR
ncbi:hypothetical protein NS506_02833 [Nocardia seriolae]|uniref:Uncharacterized protein n=1 Tax=Nocardia seriolae TaxID=37332 RepID=A0ABC8AS12_9NOCA|nr:hypothetical protein NS506_02833 [Nocardia seriolae]